MPSSKRYWNNDELFHISIIPKIMPRSRFQLLLKIWHFSDDKDCPEGIQEGNASGPRNVVLKLSKDLLDTGKTVVADNYYTSLELANIVLDHKTHLVGTLKG
nr:unnamed protein product [Callosobruchus chinensis]